MTSKLYTHFKDFKGSKVAFPDDPAEVQIPHLTPGAYTINPSVAGPMFTPIEIKHEPIFQLPCPALATVIDEVQRFWDRRPHYQKYKVPHKRGILLYGPPGSGKSTTIREVAKDIISRGGIVTYMVNADLFRNAMQVLRSIQPEIPVVMILEDLDSLIDDWGESQILNVLDGFEELDRTLFIATTNYVNKLSKRIANRPSRFDRKILVDYPSADNRRAYLQHLDRFRELGESRLDLWVESSNGMSLAHLKELFTATVILGQPDEEAIITLQQMSHQALVMANGDDDDE